MILETINSPNDLKKLNISEMELLSQEIRDVIIKKTSEKGGHLGSNLGIVELTIAIHYVFDSPLDQIILDVSHQSAPHKILTGRKEAFSDSSKYGTISGFTNPDESAHDLFNIGHTSTSISLASGLAKYRDVNGGNNNVVAVIGDGSLSGGEALEGFDYVGSDIEGNLIIIINDNQISMAENHGGLYKNLSVLRETEGNAECNIFRAFGLDYMFVKEGNNVQSLIDALKKIKDIDHPIVVHVCTVKGKGYEFAEQNQETTHFVSPFDIQTGASKIEVSKERYDKIIGNYLLDKMKADSKVFTLMAATPVVLDFTEEKRKEAGKQYIDVGIAEEHAIAMAAGIAKNGGKPVFSTKSTFIQRAYDQISQEVCMNNLPVTMIVVNASVFVSTDMSHLGFFDIPMMSNIPNLVYLAPTNKEEYLAMLDWSIEQSDYPVAIRAPRNGVYYSKGTVDKEYSCLNKYKVEIEGNKVAILALGDFFQIGEEITKKFQDKYGYAPTLINPRYITGVDEELLTEISEQHSLVITLEDGILDGGFGQKIASFYGKSEMKVLNYGLKKEFLNYFNVKDVLMENRLDANLILEDIAQYI